MNPSFQFRVRSIVVKENGSLNQSSTKNYLSATLVYPKEGIPSVETIREIDLEDEKEFFFSDLNFPESLIFKQSFQGDSFLSVKITRKIKSSKIEKLINKAIEAGLIAGLSTITGGVGAAILTGVSKSIVNSIFDLEDDEKKKLPLIGEGFAYVNSSMEEGDLKIALANSKRVYLGDKHEMKNGETIVKKVFLKPGKNGEIILDVKKLLPHPQV